MGKRQKEWARRARAELLEKLGGQCVECGTAEKLTFDCKRPLGDIHHRMDTASRMSFYRQQYRQGNLQILCHYHNSIKSAKDRQRFDGAQLPF